MTQLVRVPLFSVTSDGYGSGLGQTLKHPFGNLDEHDLHGWCFTTAAWKGEGGSRGIDDLVVAGHSNHFGAEIMGRKKFWPEPGPWRDPEWKGWWGDEPPFHAPVFVLTHYPRPPIHLSDTTFHFIDASPNEAVRIAKQAADGKDVRIGGGVSTIRQFLDAGLIDSLCISVTPAVAGRGERLWESPDELLDRYQHESASGTSGVIHHFFWR